MPASDLEREFLWLCKVEQLPTPEREVRVVPGRRFRFDFVFEPQKVAVEVDGGQWIPGGGRHQRGSSVARDAEKMNLAQLEGYRVFRFTTSQIKDGSCIRVLKEALA